MMRRYLRELSLFLVAALILAVVGGGMTLAQGESPPPPPQGFWGSVSYQDGGSVASGTVEATMNGTVRDSITIKDGQYGGPGPFDRRLNVSGTIDEIGSTIEFYVNGVKANETATWVGGQTQPVVRLDLTVAAAPPPQLPQLVEISVSPQAVSLTVGQTRQLVVTAKYDDQSTKTVTSEATYTSSNTQVASVSSQGLVTAVAAGQATITVSYEGKEATVNVTVSQPSPPVGGGGGGGVTLPPPAPKKVEVTVQPGKKTVAVLEGIAAGEAGPGAISGENSRLLVSVVEDTNAAPLLAKAVGLQAASPVVDVSVIDGTVAGQLTIAIYYDALKIGAGKGAAIYYYSDRKEQWVYLGGERDGNKLVIVVTHLTKFAVFGRDPVPSFTDMEEHWAKALVTRLAGMGVVAGYPGGLFKPGEEVTRAQCTVMLVRALGLPEGTDLDLAGFTDAGGIPLWARGAVAAAVKHGLMKGYPEPDGSATFRAGQSMTRNELAVLIARIMEKEIGPTTGTVQFADADKIPGWAREAVGAVAAKGIVTGYEDQTFRGENIVTRAEAAAMILRLLDLIL